MHRGQVGQPEPRPGQPHQATGAHDPDIGDQRCEGRPAQHHRPIEQRRQHPQHAADTTRGYISHRRAVDRYRRPAAMIDAAGRPPGRPRDVLIAATALFALVDH